MATAIHTFHLNRREYFYINSPRAVLQPDIFSHNLVGRVVVMGEKAEIAKFGLIIHSDHLQRFFTVRTSDGYSGFLPEKDVIQRSTPYETNVHVNRLKATIYTKISSEGNESFNPDILVYQGTKLQALSQAPVSQGENFFWVEVALPDGQTRYIKSTKVTFDP